MKVFNFLCICCLILTQANLSEQDRMILIIGWFLSNANKCKWVQTNENFFQTLETIQLAMYPVIMIFDLGPNQELTTYKILTSAPAWITAKDLLS